MNAEVSEENRRMKGIEMFILGICTLYIIGIIFLIHQSGWSEWFLFFVYFGAFAIWLQYLTKTKTLKFRATFLTLFLQLTLITYSVFAWDISSIIAFYVTTAVILGMYGIPQLMYLVGLSLTIMLVLHVFVFETIPMFGTNSLVTLLPKLFSLYCCVIVVYMLIKKQQENRERLQDTIEDLRVAEQSKDDFLANVSHEIRTPINTIYGISEVLLKESFPDAVRENIYSIQNASRNLLSVVSDILDFSELQAGKLDIDEEKYNISSTINDVIQMTLAKIYEKPIEFVVNCDATLPSGLIGDEQKIRRVMLNLIGNAIKFTDHGGVAVHVGYRKESYGINLIVSVRDTGIGMKPESLEKIFTSFNQVDTKRSRKGEGIGLGLHISQAIIQKMGGFLNINSEYGKGTEVQFVIPQKVENEEPISKIKNAQNLNTIVYINMEQFTDPMVREEYAMLIQDTASTLGLKTYACRNQMELERREERESFSHIFISILEYKENEEYYDRLSERAKVVIFINQSERKQVKNSRLLLIYKPFTILSIASLLNGEHVEQERMAERVHERLESFIAPDAHVLVVDDNIMNLKVIEGLLKPYKIRVTTATSGKMALDKIETMDYDFIFMDHMMSGMDGIETLERIRKMPSAYCKTVPIIALTANAVAGAREMFIEKGFQDYVTKPIEFSVLERVLRRTLPQNKIIKVSQLNDMEKEKKKGALQSAADGEFTVGDFDVKKGISYCGSQENYLEALQMYYMNSAQTKNSIESMYKNEDWKNYTILVHALKSSMLSIGVVHLSEMAKALEAAGRQNDIDTIKKNHGAMIEEFDRVISVMRNHEKIGGSPSTPYVEEQSDTENETEITEREFDEMLLDFEDAAYSFDGEKLLKILDSLQGKKYKTKNLRDTLAVMRKKVQMSDYLSALNMLSKIKDQ